MHDEWKMKRSIAAAVVTVLIGRAVAGSVVHRNGRAGFVVHLLR